MALCRFIKQALWSQTVLCCVHHGITAWDRDLWSYGFHQAIFCFCYPLSLFLNTCDASFGRLTLNNHVLCLTTGYSVITEEALLKKEEFEVFVESIIRPILKSLVNKSNPLLRRTVFLNYSLKLPVRSIWL